MSEENWHKVIGLNLDSALHCSRAATAHLRDSGRIVNISSLAGHNEGGAGSTAYATAKAGMFGFTQGLAKEFAPRGIMVNAIAPGLILNTPFHKTFTPEDAQFEASHDCEQARCG